jgi:hypothetical protein
MPYVPLCLFSLLIQLTRHHIAPLELIKAHIRRFHALGISYEKMIPLLATHYDTDSYGLGCVVIINFFALLNNLDLGL